MHAHTYAIDVSRQARGNQIGAIPDEIGNCVLIERIYLKQNNIREVLYLKQNNIREVLSY